MLFDFSHTLFHIEDAEHALLAALGPDFVHWSDKLRRLGAINGSSTSEDLPPHLVEPWDRRDLSAESHRAAYSGLSVHAGLTPDQAHLVYERGLSPEAWSPYPDTVAVLRRLHANRIPVALVSNIGWDPRPVLEAYEVADYFRVLVLSDERGVIKPAPEIFRQACADLGIRPRRALMVGDNPEADGGAEAIGCLYHWVPAAVADRRGDELLRAVGLVDPADISGGSG